MSDKISNVVALLKQAKPAEIAELDFVKDRFITIYNQIHGSDKGEMIYFKELFNYKKLLAENATLRECSQLSLYGCFLDINVNGHSLEGGTKPDCYLIPENFNVGTKDQPVWEKRAKLNVSPYGELKMRMRAGQVKYADDAVVVYEGDMFKIGTNEKGKLVVKEYEKNFSNKDNAKIIACFVRIERPDGSFEMPYLDIAAINRLKGYSDRKNKGKGANPLYSSNGGQIDTGFLMAKTLKHAFSSYPKVQTGQFTSLEPLEETIPGQPVDYGFNADEHSANAVQDIQHEEVDEFQAALDEKSPDEETVQMQVVGDDDPEF